MSGKLLLYGKKLGKWQQGDCRINDNLEQQARAIFDDFSSCTLKNGDGAFGKIGDVVTLQRGYDLPKMNMVNGPYSVEGSTGTLFYHAEYNVEPPVIILGRSGNIGKPRLYLNKIWAHNTTLFTKYFKNSNPFWVYHMLCSIDYSQFNGGSAVPTLNRNHVHDFQIFIPLVERQNKFGELIRPIHESIKLNKIENITIKLMRDYLLPKLISGELDVSTLDI